MGEKPGCCKCCCSFIFTSGLSALFMWLSLRADNPKCSVDYFYLPALNRTLNSTTNSTLYFNLKLANPNKDKGINYDDVKVNVTVFDTVGNGSQSSQLLGDTTIQRFYQGHKKTAKKPGHVDYNMTVVNQGIFTNGTAFFRIDLVTAVRFKIMFWRTKRHKIMVGAKVVVDGNGSMVLAKKKKDIPLGSMAPKQGCCSLVLLILVNFLVLINLVNF
ncbi:hypothetical protein SLEP1_g25246 [Rubroshorea leprosula]|uniref:Late embryogenesis abundant protein LEA-2 subgroup domain-containing protein n=1 Tax=Rubroshorea leprosula TaxID=152421 RepID=A0AAV5JVN0_9ROSI|nr:hypothetical protein SLEP1_g25246 [Rubroshorea leprosula]